MFDRDLTDSGTTVTVRCSTVDFEVSPAATQQALPDHAALDGVVRILLTPSASLQLSTGLERTIVVEDLESTADSVGGDMIFLGNFPLDLVREAVETVCRRYSFYAVLSSDAGVVVLLFEQRETKGIGPRHTGRGLIPLHFGPKGGVSLEFDRSVN